MNPDPMPDTITSENLQGYKRAYPLVVLEKSIHQKRASVNDIVSTRFRAHIHPTIYKTHSEAVCEKGYTHHPPGEQCECGFYALKSRPLVEDGIFAGGARRIGAVSAVLTVTLYGEEIIEGAKGWRGSAQHVTDVSVDPRCGRCHKQAQHVALYRPLSKYAPNVFTLENVCDDCLRFIPEQKHVTLSVLTGLYGTDVHIADVRTWLRKPKKYE